MYKEITKAKFDEIALSNATVTMQRIGEPTCIYYDEKIRLFLFTYEELSGHSSTFNVYANNTVLVGSGE